MVNRYDNALLHVDEQIGRVMSYLSQSGRLKDTLVIVTSDHGELFWEHEMVTHGRSLVEEEVRVPFLMHYPPALAARDEERLVSTLDVLPLLADILEVPPHPSFQGTGFLRDSEVTSEDRAIFMNIQGMKTKEAVVCGHQKLVLDRGTGKRELFDLSTDPHEKTDLSNKRPQTTEALSLLLSAQMRAQLRYHNPRDESERQRRFAPRMAGCSEF